MPPLPTDQVSPDAGQWASRVAQTVLRPELMQYKRMDDAKTGTTNKTG
jgi:hypothetical protein